MIATHASVWQLQHQSKTERAEELAALEREVVRAERRLTAETLLGCVVCCAVGVAMVSWSVHTTDPGWGGIAFWSGLLIGDVGMFALLLRHAHRREEEGY